MTTVRIGAGKFQEYLTTKDIQGARAACFPMIVK
jgi:hypothetical protein